MVGRMRRLAGGLILGFGLFLAPLVLGSGIELRTGPIEFTGDRPGPRPFSIHRPLRLTTPVLRMTGAGR